MKKLLLGIGLVSLLAGCATSLSTTAYETLATVGATEKASVTTMATLYHNGKITAAQWNTVAQDDATFDSVYSVACVAAASNLATAAVPANVTAAAATVNALVPTTP
jgi:hypothetical protein